MTVWNKYFSLEDTVISHPKMKDRMDMKQVPQEVKQLFSENGTQYIWAKYYEIEGFKKGDEKMNPKKFFEFKQALQKWTIEDLYKFHSPKNEDDFSMKDFYQAMLETFKKGDENIINILTLTFPKATAEVLDFNRREQITLQDNKILRCFTKGLGVSYDFAEKKTADEVDISNLRVRQHQNSEYRAKYLRDQYNNKGQKQYANSQTSKAPANTVNKKDIPVVNESQIEDEKILRARESYQRSLEGLFDMIPTNYKELDVGRQYLLKTKFSTGLKESLKQVMAYNNLNLRTVVQDIVLPSLASFNKAEIDIFNDFSNKQEKFELSADFFKGALWKQMNSVDEEVRSGIYEFLGNKVKLVDTQENIYKSVFTTLSLITKDEKKFKERLDFLNQIIPNVKDLTCYIRLKDLGNGKHEVETASYTKLMQANSEVGFVNTSIKHLLLKFDNPMWREVLTMSITPSELDQALKQAQENRAHTHKPQP